MRKFSTSDLIGYAVFAALFLAVAGLRPAHAVDPGAQMKPGSIVVRLPR
ncbi:MAG: hypothetical protein WDN01_00535 [Rhizomicrobium sp.]